MRLAGTVHSGTARHRLVVIIRRHHRAAIALAAAALLAGPAGWAEAPPEGFTALFNGTDLTGWRGAVDGYEAVAGTIRCKPGTGGNLFTAAEYSDFVLRFEFRLPPGGNNGLGIRMPPEGNPAVVAMELQILDDANPKYAAIEPWQAHGSIYGVVPARRGCLKPAGEWNTEEVTALGSRITVVVNGQTVVDADVAEFRDGKTPTADGHPHPGLARTTGHIGFLGHGDAVRFRNLFIKPLPQAGH